MPRIASLPIPGVSTEFLDFLRANHIVTLEDFLTTDLYGLPEISGGSKNAKEYREGIVAVLEHLEAHHAATWHSGSSLLSLVHPHTHTHSPHQPYEYHQQQHVHPPFISTGCASLDDLLGGGLKIHTITELVGSSASGKTQVCLQLCASTSVSLPTPSNCLFVDSSCSFSGSRVAKILPSLLPRHLLQESSLKRAMQSIIRVQVFTLFDLMSLLESITARCRGQVAQGERSFFSDLKVLILDSPSSLIGPLLGGPTMQGHALMICFSRTLKRMVKELNIAVLMTNHTVSGEGGEPKGALGESWKAVPDVRVWLQRDRREEDVCVASLSKHSAMPIGGEIKFRVTRAGLQSYEGPHDSA